ncbi:magnesium/cobalt transporter CorA [Terrilactibacillus sp. S3-3]|nr:magnesium/cobalt transporter CorA [Terrilactibacillus sp. S3-3]
MIRILAKTTAGELIKNIPLDAVHGENIEWYWIDLNEPKEAEIKQFQQFFNLYSIAAGDSRHHSKRPQLKYFSGYNFLAVHAMSPKSLRLYEIDLFVNHAFIISLHGKNLKEINDVWHAYANSSMLDEDVSMNVLHKILDKIVDKYFLIAGDLEDRIDAIDKSSKKEPIQHLINRVFRIRSDLLSFRHVALPFRDIINRILESKHFQLTDAQRAQFRNIYDNLARLTHMVESNMEITADIRDSYISLTSYRMNNIMKTLTVITTIFMPLTFIAGIYGMNFKYMPELSWRAGYYFVLGTMFGIGLAMFIWFKKKGWFDGG